MQHLYFLNYSYLIQKMIQRLNYALNPFQNSCLCFNKKRHSVTPCCPIEAFSATKIIPPFFAPHVQMIIMLG